jgi:hypothetical protein
MRDKSANFTMLLYLGIVKRISFLCFFEKGNH